jgi:hypothetical protein
VERAADGAEWLAFELYRDETVAPPNWLIAITDHRVRAWRGAALGGLGLTRVSGDGVGQGRSIRSARHFADLVPFEKLFRRESFPAGAT